MLSPDPSLDSSAVHTREDVEQQGSKFKDAGGYPCDLPSKKGLGFGKGHSGQGWTQQDWAVCWGWWMRTGAILLGHTRHEPNSDAGIQTWGLAFSLSRSVGTSVGLEVLFCLFSILQAGIGGQTWF